MVRIFKLFSLLSFSFLVISCSAPKYDYTKYRAAKPKSILVLPPVNNSVEVGASEAVFSTIVRPISEAGYYVFPPTLVTETFTQNGFTQPDEIHKISLDRLDKIYGPDAVLYININQYGQKYFVIGSSAIVTLEARLIDVDTKQEIWSGVATANSNENSSGNQAGLVGLLVKAAIEQVAGELLDASYPTAKIASDRLLSPKMPNTLLKGPRHSSPDY